MRFDNMKIGTRLALAFSLLILLIGVVAFSGWRSLVESERRITEIVEGNNRKAAIANDVIDSLNVIAGSVRNYLLTEDPAMREQQRALIAQTRQKYDAAFKEMHGLLSYDKERQLYALMASHRDQVRPLFNQVLTLADRGEAEQAKKFLQQQAQGPLDSWFADVYALIEEEDALTASAVASLKEEFRSAGKLMAVVLAVSVLTGIAAAVLITRSITVPLNHAVDIAQTIAGGDLSPRIEALRKDETGDLMRALRAMNDSLHRIVEQVQHGTGTITTASSEIASGQLDLSARTEEQASSLEETASSMEELTATVKHNAASARQADAMAIAASEVARKSGEVVAELVGTMGAINASATKIADIISVIDGIAFQTNILALNAAVEAARAGEQGRGFAVVATEVRNLAQRSATAAREIKSLIDDSVRKVASGTELANHAGATMRDVVDSVKRVTDVIGEISAASQEQSAGIEQVNRAVVEMDTVTQQNAALVEEATAAAEALQAQARHLSSLVAVFRLRAAVPASVPATVSTNGAPAQDGHWSTLPALSHDAA